MFSKLLSLFNDYGVEYEHISEKEIVVPCPANVVDNEKIAMQPQTNLFNEPGLTDEIYVHIAEDEFGMLSWLVAYARPEEDDKE